MGFVLILSADLQVELVREPHILAAARLAAALRQSQRQGQAKAARPDA
jgi:hypothetical protein